MGILFCFIPILIYGSVSDVSYVPMHCKTFQDFLKEASEDQGLKLLADHLSEVLDKRTGARIEFPHEKMPLQIKVQNFSSLLDQHIYAGQVYASGHNFQEYLNGQRDVLDQSKHTVVFKSLSGNILVIPRGPYVEILSFIKKASLVEKEDFWQMVLKIFNTLIVQKRNFRIATHVGSAGFQSVPHFHLRFEF